MTEECCSEEDTEGGDSGPDATYEMSGGAGWVSAEAEGETPEEAYEYWLKMWERMVDDVEGWSGSQRQQAGLRQ